MTFTLPARYPTTKRRQRVAVGRSGSFTIVISWLAVLEEWIERLEDGEVGFRDATSKPGIQPVCKILRLSLRVSRRAGTALAILDVDISPTVAVDTACHHSAGALVLENFFRSTTAEVESDYAAEALRRGRHQRIIDTS